MRKQVLIIWVVSLDESQCERKTGKPYDIAFHLVLQYNFVVSICNWNWYFGFELWFRSVQLLQNYKMLSAYLVICLRLLTFNIMELMRRKLTLMSSTVNTCWKLQKSIVRLLNVRSSRLSRDKNWLVKLPWQRNSVDRQKNKGKFRLSNLNLSRILSHHKKKSYLSR